MLGHYYMPVLCNYAAMKMNVLSYTNIVDSYTQNNILILNALLECIKFLPIHIVF